MKEIKLDGNRAMFKLLAYDEVTKELFVTVRFDIRSEYEKTYIFQKINKRELTSINKEISSLADFDKESFLRVFKGHPYRQALYTLTDIKDCIDDGDSVTGECEMPLETLEYEKDESLKKEADTNSQHTDEVRANFSRLYRNIALSRRKKGEDTAPVSQIMTEIPAQGFIPLETPIVHKPSYLFECNYRIVLKDLGNKTHSIPIYILAESVNDLDSIFRDTITSPEFLKRFKVESFVLTSARVIGSVKFDENFPLLVSYKEVFSS